MKIRSDLQVVLNVNERLPVLGGDELTVQAGAFLQAYRTCK